MATQRQIKTAEILVESGGTIGVSNAMRQAGYSAKTAKTPKKFTEAKGFTQISEEIVAELHDIKITPKKIAKIIKQGLNAKQPAKVVTIDKVNGEVRKHTEQEPDHNTRHKFLDTTLKIMSAYPKEDKSAASIIVAKFKEIADTYMEDVPDEYIEGEVSDASN